MDDTHFRARALPITAIATACSLTLWLMQDNSGQLISQDYLCASFSQYCENSFCREWILLRKVFFLCQKSQQISGEYSSERLDKISSNDTLRGSFLK